MGNMVEVYIIWPPRKKKVVNHSHMMRDLMEWGEEKQIMASKARSMHRVMENVCGHEDLEDQCSLNSGFVERKDPSKVSILFLLFPEICL